MTRSSRGLSFLCLTLSIFSPCRKFWTRSCASYTRWKTKSSTVSDAALPPQRVVLQFVFFSPKSAFFFSFQPLDTKSAESVRLNLSWTCIRGGEESGWEELVEDRKKKKTWMHRREDPRECSVNVSVTSRRHAARCRDVVLTFRSAGQHKWTRESKDSWEKKTDVWSNLTMNYEWKQTDFCTEFGVVVLSVHLDSVSPVLQLFVLCSVHFLRNFFGFLSFIVLLFKKNLWWSWCCRWVFYWY